MYTDDISVSTRLSVSVWNYTPICLSTL